MALMDSDEVETDSEAKQRFNLSSRKKNVLKDIADIFMSVLFACIMIVILASMMLGVLKIIMYILECYTYRDVWSHESYQAL